ncbi:MAG: hypothetical protein M3320_00115 [Actinomycetota bacterium]|nr:hypothetical protein [Actinomycetota bacterium]
MPLVSPRGWSDRAPLVEAGAYQRHVHAPQEQEEAVLTTLRAARVEIIQKLTERATRQLGPAFAAEVRDMRAHEGVIITAVVGSVTKTAIKPTLTPNLIRFADTIEDVVRSILEVARLDLPTDVTVDFGEAAPDAAGGSAWDRLAPVIAAIASGLGVIGFVTFVGGAIQYGRFAGAGLPASEAVSVIPAQTLIVLGAEALAYAVLIGLGYAAIVFIVREATSTEGDETSGLLRGPSNWKRAGLMFAYLLAAGAGIGLIQGVPSDAGWTVGVVAAGLVTAAVAALVARRTASVVWLTTVTFVAVGLFSVGSRVGRAWENEDVRAAALVRENKKAMIGFYVGETSDRVYIGRINTGRPTEAGNFAVDEEELREENRIVGISRDQITDLAIGPPRALSEALKQGHVLANELCERQPIIPRRDARAGQTTDPAEPCWEFAPGLDRQSAATSP